MKSSKEIDPNLEVLIKNLIYEDYSLPHLMVVLSTWNFGWRNNMNLMSEILNVWYHSFREVSNIAGKIVFKDPDAVNRSLREQRKAIEKEHSEEVDQFDKLDEAFLNFYKKPDQKLNFLYQDIKKNNEDDKKI